MAAPIIFYMDFASPYAYFALDGIEEIGREAGRKVEWRPVLIWAVFKQLGISAPMDVPAKKDYMIADMRRSADYFGVPYRHPSRLPASAHLATRLYLTIAEQDEALARQFGLGIFRSFFQEDGDITNKDHIIEIAVRHGIDGKTAEEAMNAPRGRELLAAGIDRAIADNVIGSPFFLVDGEPFFGADRLPQVKWRLRNG
jgi:2-hydroxychromene-2-carboxylate isomerase